MTRRFVSSAMMAVGLPLLIGATAACSDDSTASAPITSNPVTTTSMYSGVESSTPANPSGSTTPSTTTTPGAPQSGLPATGPTSATPTGSNYPGAGTAQLSDKARRYLIALRTQNVTFAGDTDNSVALTMAEYVCGARSKGTDPVTIKAFVTASIGPSTRTAEEANVKADKIIAAAADNYC